MKKIRRDKPIGVLIHVSMEISQGNYFYLEQAKMSFFSSKNWKTGGQNRP
jgi:hypothetical protein